ncbi:transcriptional regulator [Rhizobium sp. CF122]|jgi:TetR/AcrR family transcriptional repressor of nem operon|uniref:TetR/AcrR family transcriptional regulator n=1 Tax=unclassified Rhizobium TaxID=2613769 RepID=UPI000271B9DA|nr:TetR/AcrR family transcriptional regulator [Rhizobium sp. CF122]EJL57831.1 transcriptional regulator [Rhizobium sp. CF122]
MVSRTRQKIVDAALEQFHEFGYNGSSVNDVVERAGVPKGSFYNYFKAKELLALEVLKIYSAGSGREILADKSLRPLERIKQHFSFMADRYDRFGYARGCLIGNLAAESTDEAPLVRQALAESLSRWTGLLEEALKEGQELGEVPSSIDARKTARFLINAWEGAVIRMKIVAAREPLDDFFDIALALLHGQRKEG